MISSMSKASSSSSSTNWLDRLRSSKGFPLSPKIDLDHLPNPPQKTSRKQRNPNHVVPPSSSAADAAAPSIADNSVAESGRIRTSAAVRAWKLKMMKKKKREGCGSAESDMAGFSRTGVTVIDSSSGLPEWKSEMVVFRKGVVWKVREKKLRRFGRKKRKVGSAEKAASGKEKSRSVPAAAAAAVEEEVADKGVDFKESDDQIILTLEEGQSL